MSKINKINKMNNIMDMIKGVDTDVIYNFIAGGLLIAVSGYISKYYSSYISGLIYGSLPFGAYYLYLYSIYNGGTEKNLSTDLDKGVDFVNGSVIGGILWVIMLAMLYLNLSNPITVVFIASVVYSLIIFLQVRVIKKD